MKINKKLLVDFGKKTLIPVFIIIILVVFASGKYGFTPVLMGIGIFTSIVLFNIVAVRIYQEMFVYFKKGKWNEGLVLTTTMLGILIGVPFVFIVYLNDSYLILGTVISVGVLGVLLVYDIIRKIFI
ncbi:hypothetical protein [Cyclobacterium sp.]|uniref:hypothetical protein n=1 Tax=Cyclobacterium sp. TaxID=1966343 RepID=UPI0019912E01|nr:hypothetical protein [Cyclobacterium sp.]MBD3630805.1 hypothetical protein [Cyclobacterium sp.]